MKKITLALFAATAFFSTAALAEPWSADYAQGNSEFTVVGGGNSELTFTCGQDLQGNDTKAVTLTGGNKFYASDDKAVTFVALIDGEKIALPNPVTPQGDTAMKHFWKVLSQSKSKSFAISMNRDVYVFTTEAANAAYKSDLSTGCLR